MKVIGLKCPGCGAKLDPTNANHNTITCDYCGTSVLVNGEVQKPREPETPRPEVTRVTTTTEPAQPVRKRKTWLWVIGWIFMFPIPLTILMLNNPRTKSLHIAARIAVVVFGWLIYFAIAAGGETDSSATNEANNQDAMNNTTVVQTQTETREGWRDVYAFVDEFNANSGMTITDIQEVDNISDEDNEYYRVAYRLSAFNNAVAVVGQIEGYGQIEILCFGNMGYSDVRVYADAKDRDQAAVMFEAIANVLVTGDDRENIAKGVDALKNSSTPSPSLYLGSKYSAGYSYEEVMIDARK